MTSTTLSCLVCDFQDSNIKPVITHMNDQHAQHVSDTELTQLWSELKDYTTNIPTSSPTIFHCHKCSDVFYNLDLLREHFKTVHISVPRLNSVKHCPLCHQLVNTAQQLEIHLQTEHIHEPDLKLFQPNQTIPLFDCKQCKIYFTSKAYLAKHNSNFHKKKQFPCNMCDYIGTTKQNCVAHINAVHLKIRFFCEKCPYSSTREHHLCGHRKRCHF